METLLGILAAWTLAGIFLLAAAHKSRHYLAFRGILAEYRLLPDPLVPWVAPLVIGAEFVGGILLLAPTSIIAPGVAAIPVGALLCLYTAAIAVNLIRGRANIDCGCGGEATPLSGWLLLRNGLLLALVGIVGAAPAASVTPTTYALAVASILFLWCAYATGNQLLANAAHPQIRSARD